MKRVGVIGDPVQHSLSPHMHNAAIRATAIDADYVLWPTTLDQLPDRIAGLRDAEVLGANVTVPHKQAVMQHLDDLTPTAQRIGAVNTIISMPDGLVGDNTDVYGFRRSIEEGFPDLDIGSVVVLGAGGACRAVIAGLQEMGVSSITLANRTWSRAALLADEFGVDIVDWDHADDRAFPSADLLVNATALGWHDEMPVPARSLASLPRHAGVADLTYRDTSFLKAASAAGHPTLDGLAMLIYQGARAFGLWLDREAPVEVMREAVIAEQRRRS